MSSSRDSKPAIDEGDNSSERVRPMQRGVSQLLFNYLPYRTVDWEDGLAIVQLGDIRFSTVWEEERKATLLKEIKESFDRWVLRGGRIDSAFPADPPEEYDRFTIGSPTSIDASVVQAALICQHCGQLIFEKKHQRDAALHCPHCSKSLPIQGISTPLPAQHSQITQGCECNESIAISERATALATEGPNHLGNVFNAIGRHAP